MADPDADLEAGPPSESVSKEAGNVDVEHIVANGDRSGTEKSQNGRSATTGDDAAVPSGDENVLKTHLKPSSAKPPMGWYLGQWEEIRNAVVKLREETRYRRAGNGRSMETNNGEQFGLANVPLLKVFEFGKKQSSISRVFRTGPLRFWMNKIDQYPYTAIDFTDETKKLMLSEADQIYYSWIEAANSHINKHLLSLGALDVNPDNIYVKPDNVYVTDPIMSCKDMVILIPNLSQVGAKLLIERYHIDPDVFERHISKSFLYDRRDYNDRNLELSDRSLDIENGTYTITLACEGDFWSHLTDCRWDVQSDEQPSTFFFTEDIRKAFGIHAMPWPVCFNMANMYGSDRYRQTQWSRRATECRVKSLVTIHAWKDEAGNRRVLVLLTPWQVIYRKVNDILQREIIDLNLSRASEKFEALTKAYAIVECGYTTGTWLRTAHIDSEPLINADRCNLSTLSYLDRESSQTDFQPYEQEYKRLGDEILQVVMASSEKDPQAVVTNIMLHIWPNIRRALQITLKRDHKRVETFRLMRSHSSDFIRRHRNNPLNTEELWLDAIDFLDDRVKSQMSTLESFERYFATKLEGAASPETEAGSVLSEGMEDIKKLKQTCWELQKACVHERQLCTLREQRVLTQKQLEETQKSILQNDLIRKLTMLAFFFIPVSAVTSAFGMNLAEISNHQPTVSTFVAAVVSVTGISIVLALLPALVEVDAGMPKVIEGWSYRFYFWVDDRFNNLLSPWAPRKIKTVTTFIYKYILTGIFRVILGPIYKCLHFVKEVREDGRLTMRDPERKRK